MKKNIICFLTAAVILSCPAAFADDIRVYLNNEKMIFDQPPVIINDSTLVPFRAIFEELDMTVQWFGDERRVTAQNDTTSISLIIDNPVMTVNGKSVELNTPPVIYNDFTLVPLRAVSEAAGASVDWSEKNRAVYITADKLDFDEWVKEVLALTNEERAKQGLDSLEWDESLASLATLHCIDMTDRNFFSHNNPDNQTPFDRMKLFGIEYLAAGENIAAGQYSPKAVVEEWMNSTGHRENILNPKFKSVGIGVVKGGEYGIYWAQEFALLK